MTGAMLRLPWALGLTLAACGGVPEAPSSAQQPPEPAALTVSEAKPHVVLITLDTTRADRLGCYGYEKARTDTLDALAAAGQLYTRAFSPLPLTIPSHSTIFTGKYPPRHGVRSNGSGVLAEEHVTLAEVFSDHGYETAASVAAFVTTRQWGFSQGFSAYFDDIPKDDTNFWHGERPANQVIDDALAWKAEQPDERPVFLWVHLFDAHFPYTSPEGYLDPDDPRPYDAEIAFVDDQLQRLVDAFSGTPTVFAVAGDHGESLGDHGEAAHGLYAYNATQHVPLIVSGSGIEPAVIDEPTSLADILPTLLRRIGLSSPDGIDGQPRPGGDAPVYMESWQLAQRFGIAPHVGLVEGRWKLLDTPRPELYDLDVDLGETTDVAADHPEVVNALRARLAGLEMLPPGQGAAVDVGTAEALAALGYVETTQAFDLTGDLPDPKDHKQLVTLVQRAERMQGSGELEEAEALFLKLVTSYPEVGEFRTRLAGVLGRQGKLKESGEQIERAMQVDPGNPHVRAMWATHLASMGRMVEAADAFAQASMDMPYSPRLRASAVQALRRAGKSEQALARADEWRAQYPGDRNLAGVLGLMRLEQRRFDEGEALLREGVEADPPELEVAFFLGAKEIARGHLKEGLALMLKEIRAYPLHLRAAVIAARIAIRQQDWEAQLEASSLVVDKNPKDAEMWHAKVLALFNLGRYPEAREAVKAGLGVAPEYPQLVLMDANLMAKEGRKDEGRARFEQAQRLLDTQIAATRGAKKSVMEELEVPDVENGELGEGPNWVPPEVVVPGGN